MKPDLPPHPTALTHEEQYSYMSMWSLMAAPLLFSGDMTMLDKFTLNVLCNAEIIDVDQDSLGKQAEIVRKTDEELILKSRSTMGRWQWAYSTLPMSRGLYLEQGLPLPESRSVSL